MPSAVSSLSVTKFRPGLQTMTFPPVIFTMPPEALTQDSARGIAASQAIHLVDADAIEVAGNRVLQGARRHRETKRVLRLAPGEQRVDDPRRKGIAGGKSQKVFDA